MAKPDRLRVVSAALIALVAATILAAGPPTATTSAVTAAQITSFQVTGPDGKVITEEPLRAGAVYRVAFTVSVAAGINDRLVLSTELSRAPGLDRFWSLNGSYPGINTTTWQPGQNQITFQAIEGQARLELTGQVPTNWVIVPLANDDIAHIARDLNLVTLSLASGPVLEERPLQVIDNLIGDYRQVLAQTAATIDNSVADARYVDFVRAMVEQARTIGEAGYAQRAIDILQGIPPSSDWVPPQGSTRYIWILVGALAVIALALGFVSMRARGENTLVKTELDEQAKRLEILSSRANRIGDAALADDIKKVKSGLEKLTGR